ncbi:MAG: hypothetical protein RL514_2714 [Verrucomicrobiota bacterium]
MATRKANSPGFTAPVRVATRLTLSAATTRIRKNGIEFQSATPIAPWTEMTVTLSDPAGGEAVRATGVVVDCRGDRHQGYTVAVVFMELTPLAQARLSLMAFSNLA